MELSSVSAEGHRTEIGRCWTKPERRDAGVKLIALAREATRAAEALLADATAAVRRRVMVEDQHGRRACFDREQRATHGLAWLATYVEAIRQLAAYAERMHAGGSLGEIEELLVQIGIGEYLAQIAGGIPDEPGRDRAAGRSRARRRGRSPRAWPGRSKS